MSLSAALMVVLRRARQQGQHRLRDRHEVQQSTWRYCGNRFALWILIFRPLLGGALDVSRDLEATSTRSGGQSTPTRNKVDDVAEATGRRGRSASGSTDASTVGSSTSASRRKGKPEVDSSPRYDNYDVVVDEGQHSRRTRNTKKTAPRHLRREKEQKEHDRDESSSHDEMSEDDSRKMAADSDESLKIMSVADEIESQQQWIMAQKEADLEDEAKSVKSGAAGSSSSTSTTRSGSRSSSARRGGGGTTSSSTTGGRGPSRWEVAEDEDEDDHSKSSNDLTKEDGVNVYINKDGFVSFQLQEQDQVEQKRGAQEFTQQDKRTHKGHENRYTTRTGTSENRDKNTREDRDKQGEGRFGQQERRSRKDTNSDSRRRQRTKTRKATSPGDIQGHDEHMRGAKLPILPPWRDPDDAVEDAVWVRRAVQLYHDEVRFTRTTEEHDDSTSSGGFLDVEREAKPALSELDADGAEGSEINLGSSTTAKNLRTDARVAEVEAAQVKKEGVFLFAMWTSLGTQKRMRASLETWMKALGPRQAVMITSAFPAQQEENQKLIRDKVAKGELLPQVFSPVAGHCRNRLSRRLHAKHALTWDWMAGYGTRNLIHLCSLPFVYQVAARIPNLLFLATTEDDAYVLPQPYQLRAEYAFSHPERYELKLSAEKFEPYPASVEALGGAGLTNTSLSSLIFQSTIVHADGRDDDEDLLPAFLSTTTPITSSSGGHASEDQHGTILTTTSTTEAAGEDAEDGQDGPHVVEVDQKSTTMEEDELLGNGTFSASTWQSTDPMAMAWWDCAGGMCGQFGFLFNAAGTHLLGAAVSHERILSHVGRWAALEHARIEVEEAKKRKQEEQAQKANAGTTVLAALHEQEQDVEQNASAPDNDNDIVSTLIATRQKTSEVENLMENLMIHKAAVDHTTSTKNSRGSGGGGGDEVSKEEESGDASRAFNTSGLDLGRMIGMDCIMGWVLKDIARAHLIRLLWQPTHFAKAQTGYDDFAANARLEPMEKTVLFHYISDPWKAGETDIPQNRWSDHYAAHRELRDHMKAHVIEEKKESEQQEQKKDAQGK
ncbi:unnamed protein product [Amoebophrya sp. A25]|nr:unnamed protein product [Amoebophrya sp. A25]|eukprot:GSA25T00019955001.1